MSCVRRVCEQDRKRKCACICEMGCGSTKTAFDDEKNVRVTSRGNQSLFNLPFQAVESWRQKREQKRTKNVNSTDDNRPLSPIKIELIQK